MYWRRVVLQWVRCSDLNPRSDHVDLKSFYDAFRIKIDLNHLVPECPINFLQTHFPDFELKASNVNEILESDHIYVFSLMLYFSCVRCSVPYFQYIGTKFDDKYQYCMKSFFNFFVSKNDRKINRSFLDNAFRNAARSARMVTAKSKDDSNNIAQILTSTPTGKRDMRKPSPPTPKIVSLEHKLKTFKSLFESARLENAALEKQNEQLTQKIQQLNEDNQKHVSKIQTLELKQQTSDFNDSIHQSDSIERKIDLLQKQLNEKKVRIEVLQEEISKGKEKEAMETELSTALKTSNEVLKQNLQKLESSHQALKDELCKKDMINSNQAEIINDLRRFIGENQLSIGQLPDPLDSSFECFDKSFKYSSADNSHSYASENLASTVVEIKLKDKELEVEIMRNKIQALESQVSELNQRLSHSDLLHKQKDTDKMIELQSNLDQEKEKSDELNCQNETIRKQTTDLEAQCVKLLQKIALQDEHTIAELRNQLAEKDVKLEKLAQMFKEKNSQYDKCYEDNEILSVKLYMARSTLDKNEDAWKRERACLMETVEKSKNSLEEKIREARIEYEDKMEKMKDRMVKLHKEMKTKLERDNQNLLVVTEQGYRKKLEGLETRCSMLQTQLAEMNERDLATRKENQLLHIKLKTLEDRKSMLLPAQASLRRNLSMEDEEGEIFNNMYLADLQNGRCGSPGPTDSSGIHRYSELMQRNSMLLPHLRTNYVALDPNCELPSDDTRDNMSTTFDDSSTGLITRRKVSGITSYKRPGPPTPSKKAGRLSLTSSNHEYKDILRDGNVNATGAGAANSLIGQGKETVDGGLWRGSRTKTPGKFKQMISSSTLLSNFQRDEVNKKKFFPYYI
ncbi:putative autophagy-related protein 11 [Anopheles nili]|uniref:putative autophagy-related protein 11 n=1 Tax=Anopheles nili TaxID=185578 RepID=UPI00237AC641|nr:putative autophagy-related protein 11 [Anopheles nili]